MMEFKDIKTEDDLKQLVIRDWGYESTGDRNTGIVLDQEIQDKILDQKVIAQYKNFQIWYFKLDEAQRTSHQKIDGFLRITEREIIGKVDKLNRNTKLFVFSSQNGDYWHFVNALPTVQINLRRFSIEPDNRNKLRTTCEQLNKIKIDKNDNLQDIIEKHKKAFDVEEVTTKFFRQFANHFSELMALISNIKKGVDQKEISDTSQVILNRLIFLKFIEKKGWLNGDVDYLYNKFQNYYDDKSLYWNEIIRPLFDLLSTPHKNPDKKLGNIPFLNGGLFGHEPKDLWTLTIPNDYFESIFENIFNRFNFTIEESSPSSVEVAVDPEMLGRIFEALILTLEKSSDIEKDLRRATGSYYTPRIVVFHMCRSAIAKSLSQKTDLSELKIKQLIDVVIDDIPDEKQVKDCSFSKVEAKALRDSVEKISICDPAVGSGAFLLISLQILVGLQRYLSLFITGSSKNDYNLKEEVISHNLIGIDILKQSVHICELRLWLSLAVDYEDKDIEKLPTLPNLTYKIFRGDSIVDYLQGYSFDYLEALRTEVIKPDPRTIQDLNSLKQLKDKYFGENNEEEKNKAWEKIERKKLEIIINILETESQETDKTQESLPCFKTSRQVKLSLEKEFKKDRKELLNRLKLILKNKKFLDTSDRLNFVWKIDLVEYFTDHGNEGFDIVIGNPPYGLKNESMVMGKERYGLGNKDSFGVFIAMAIKDLLKQDGILSFITSDTWQTIKTHKPLRRFVLDNAKIHELLMMPAWVFGATVNTSVLILSKNTGKKEFGNKISGGEERDKNKLLVCDFTRAEKKTSELDEYLYSLDKPKFYSNDKVAFYEYEQGLIETNSNIPFFIGSPKLFQLMNDTTCQKIEKEIGKKEKKEIQVRQIKTNGNIVELVRFGDISVSYGGIKAYEGIYDNYIRTSEGGRYLKIEYSLVKETLTENEQLTGIEDDEQKKYISMMKFGEHIIDDVLLNYNDFTSFYLPWNKSLIKKLEGMNSLRNRNKYFGEGLFFSVAGAYAPCFRYAKYQLFDINSHLVNFFDNFDPFFVLGILSSKLNKFLLKTFINHSAGTNTDDVDEILFILKFNNNEIQKLVDQIINKQKQNPRYDYMSNEQKEIDKLVYEMYGLNKDDIQEVECWYARRYPKLARFCDII